jgi:isoleucyl-tRNA synthetase
MTQPIDDFNPSEEGQAQNFSFIEMEHNILRFWREESIFKKSLENTRGKAPYIFYDGPPFATGLPHHGHLVGSILKDIIPRYFTMKGRYVERRFGWDCHGLPIEHEIDKKLGMNAHDAVAKLGVKAYNDECRAIVQRYTQEWEKTISRIGRWVDFENDYKTMDLPFMESVWWAFKQLWEKGLVYQGNKVVPYSTALGTVLSNFEASQNYQDVQDPAVTVLFPAVDEENVYYAAWTTTPWTLPSNLGLCVGADIPYVRAYDKEKKITVILAEARLEHYKKKNQLEILETFTGDKLKGKRYTPLFPYFQEHAAQGTFQIFNDGYVTTTDGTGIVHLAPAFGEDDYRVMKEAKVLVSVCPLDEHGKFTDEVQDFKGLYIKDADKLIIKNLKDRNQLFEQSVIVHSYPFCYRSDTPLIYRAIPSWYINVESIREQLLASNAQIHWVPEHIKEGRFGKWLEGARDWAISRNRVWGTPLPVWINDESGKTYCLGSIEELSTLTGATITDLHRENVDHLYFSLPGETGTYRRIPEVFDCWFESGSMPYAQLHYPFENADLFEKGFPAEYIAEGLDQTRGWFYTLTVLSTAIFGKPAFKNVIVNGIVKAEDGKKMSKRLKNYTPPDELMEQFGADALRLYLITSGLVKAEDQRFANAGVKEMVRKALLPWLNAFKFFQTYAKIDQWSATTHSQTNNNITDNWILSKLQTLKITIEKEMAQYQLYNVVPNLFLFIEDLTNWYIRLNRSRFWADGLEKDKCAAYTTLFETLWELTHVMAPFAPFLSEYIFQELKYFKADALHQSVHLATFPTADTSKQRPELEEAMTRMQEVILLGRQKRNTEKIKVKTPLQSLTIVQKDQTLLQEIQKLEFYIKGELNVKEVHYSNEESRYIKLYAKPNSPVLGKVLGKDFAKYRESIEKLSNDAIENFERSGTVLISGREFKEGELLIFREALSDNQALSNKLITIVLDTTMSDALLKEGLAREIVARIQKLRKDSQLNVEDRISCSLNGDEELLIAAKEFQQYIKQETLCDHLDIHGAPKNFVISTDIDAKSIQISLEKSL